MTAEVAIMNKSAIALAADSAVTVSKGKTAKKIYNSQVKLFSLSKYHPIGIMIFGNGSLMGLPWETIIKLYRNSLGKKELDSVQGYVDGLIEFLTNNKALFSPEFEKKFVLSDFSAFLRFLKEKVDEEISGAITKDGKVKPEQAKALAFGAIEKFIERIERSEPLAGARARDAANFLDLYGADLARMARDFFAKIFLEGQLSRIVSLYADIKNKKRYFLNVSGVVVAGYGKKENFPKLTCFEIDSVLCGRPRYHITVDSSITHENPAAVIPFAQREEINNFMEGINPKFERIIVAYLNRFMEHLPKRLLDGVVEPEKLATLGPQIAKSKAAVMRFIEKEIDSYKQENHIGPVVNAVQFLPKDEMANMAETLVNLTSFKRRMTLGPETVGGPIDVAIISKGDGFVWIKRKHYFKPELNHHYFHNYFEGG